MQGREGVERMVVQGREGVKRWMVGATWPNGEVIEWTGGGGNMEELWATSL